MDGLGQLSNEAYSLSSKLTNAAEETSSIRNSNAWTNMYSEPVVLEQQNVSTVPNYGSGIAPYFLSLALVVGGIMASNIFPLGKRKEQIVNGTHHLVNKLGLVYTMDLFKQLL